MGKMFEDYFSEIQADMVSICLEYVEKRAEKIYIYCSFENGMISSGFFYKVNSKIVKKNKLNDVIVDGQKKYDVSIPRQKGAINIINDDIKALKRLCQEHQKEMPTQIKLVYDVISNRINADYSYDIIHFIRREMLDFTAFPVFFVSNLLLVQRKKYYFNRATVSRNCSIVL